MQGCGNMNDANIGRTGTVVAVHASKDDQAAGRRRWFLVGQVDSQQDQPGHRRLAGASFIIYHSTEDRLSWLSEGAMGYINQSSDIDGYLVYAGTYTQGDSQGIYIFWLDMPTGGLWPVGVARDVDDPSYLVVDEERSRLFAVNELMTFDGGAGRLRANRRPWTEADAGSGPRHLIFQRDGMNAYVINELDSTITAFAYDAPRGRLESIQVVSTLPEEYAGSNIVADLHPTPDGRFLMGSNQGHDSIAVYAVDEESGRLRTVDLVPTLGKTPRAFAIDPSGTYVLAANQNSDSIVTFRIDKDQGKLSPTGQVAYVPSPVCLKFRRGD
jgi:6-phosphogluconolactonase (cycloisomerase 2 family)